MEMFAIRSVISILIIACIIKYYETFLPYNISVYVKECFEDAASDVPPEAYMTTPEIIVKRGYPLEIHHVTTEDGYILELHRIPSSKKSIDGVKKKPVFLQHGIMACDFVWVAAPTDLALGYVLADKGYDVWLGNTRGNTYSRKHTKLDPDGQAYWNYSWDELGRYDIPACVDYVLNVTQQEKLIYIGYSLGSAIFFVTVDAVPDINDKIEMMIGIAPTSVVSRLDSLFGLIAPFNNMIQVFLRWANVGLFLPEDGLPSKLLRFICRTSSLGAAFGKFLTLKIFGYSENISMSMVHILMSHYPAGGSTKLVDQFFQNYNSGGKFTHFNYDTDGNVQHYGSPTAPEFDISLTTTPVYLFWGETDGVAPQEDVEWLASRLGNLKASMKINAYPFAHGDFFMSDNVTQLVNNPLLDILPTPY